MGGPGSEREVSLASGGEVVKALKAGGHHVLESDIGPDQLDALDHPEIEVVFPALHGPFGEGGQLQKILEERNIPFVGSDSAASALAMDKYRSKKCFTQVVIRQISEINCSLIHWGGSFSSTVRATCRCCTMLAT